jgi:hypothetical protein
MILINRNRLLRLKFNSQKINEYVHSIDGLAEFMEYHKWTKIPAWAFTSQGKELMIRTVKIHQAMMALGKSLNLDSR